MERLPGVDAGFLYMETPTQHMHTLKVALVDASAVPGGYTFERLQAELADRLHLLPPFRRRVVELPLRLHHPVWAEVDSLDQDAHVRRRAVPAPGGMKQLEQVIGEIAGTPLDRSRPLWEMTVCEGMADGRVAVVAKLHHAIADGVAANALLANVTDGATATDRDTGTDGGTAEPRAATLVPPGRVLLIHGLLDVLRLVLALPPLLLRTARSVALVVRQRRTAQVRPPRPILDTPTVSFNRALTARRSFATASLSLADAKRVKDGHGVTLNDVVLAVVAGAVRGYLDASGERPSKSLVAGVPVGTDPRGAAVRLGGNRVSNLFTSLCTDVDDPVQRLKDISAVTREAKGVQAALGLDMLESWVEYTPPAPFSAFMRAYSRWRLADRHPAPFNLVVSNVPGPPVEVAIGGAVLTDVYSVGPILEGIGLNVTVWSYQDRLNFSALACPDTLPDLPALTDRLPAALAELLATVDTTRAE